MYSDDSVWRELQDYLPENNRITDDIFPQEYYCSILNYRIHIDEYVPQDASDVCVVMLHGVGGNGRLLSFLAVPLCSLGFEVVCPDLPGYGFSEYEDYPVYNDWIDVAYEIVQKKLQGNKKVFLLGLSAGGMLAYNVACKETRVSGVIVTNILDNRIDVVREYSARNKFQGKLGLKLLSYLPNVLQNINVPISWVTNMSALVNNDKVLGLLLQDKRGAGNKVQLGFLLSMMNSIPIKEPEAFLSVPVLMCHPGNDRWTPIFISELFFGRITAQKVKVILENCGHFPIEQPGNAQLLKAVVAFINQEAEPH